MTVWIALLAPWCAGALAMAALWRAAEKRGNASAVDVAWTALVGAFALWFCAVADGNVYRRVLVAVVSGVWSLRLALYLLGRVSRLPEDGRYTRLRIQWGQKASRNFFFFFQAQALWSVLFAIPIFVAARSAAPLGLWDALGVCVAIVAVAGELAADRQLSRFRSDSRNTGRVCQKGLWRYSRHPNYFFEWLHWWAYVWIGASAPYGWITLGGPALMLLFLLKVTGIPPTEAHALASRGEAYREYQRTTSVFFPWPPRKTV